MTNGKHFLFSILCLGCAFGAEAGQQPVVAATFEDLPLAPDSHWIGDVDDEDYLMGTFRSGSFQFNNFYWADYATWSFFGYANHTSRAYTSMQDQWNCAAGGGHLSPTYGVLYVADWIGPSLVELPDFQVEGAEIEGMWVCNTTWVQDFIDNGDYATDPYGKGDWLRLTVIGNCPDGEETSAEAMLADFTSEDPADWKSASDWQWMDLSGLGKVKGMRMTIASSKSNAYGDCTPSYVCIDDLGRRLSSGVGTCGPEQADFRISRRGSALTVSSRHGDFEASAYSLSGLLLSRGEATDGHCLLDAPEDGLVMVRVSVAGKTLTLKVAPGRR